MPISFIGDIPNSTERVETWYSLDHALADEQGHLGWPLRSLVELYGPKNVGKTTCSLSVMGLLATRKHKKISIMDLEIQERTTVEKVLESAGYSDEVYYIMNKDKERPEETLGRFTERMFEKNPDISLIDSLGGYRPNAELEGDIGDRNVGQKALEIGQLSGRLIRGLQLADNPNSIIMTNHVHPTIGAMIQGNVTSGGETKKYLSHIRISLKRCFFGKKVADFGESWLVEGHIDSNRFGYSKRDFYAYMVGGEGVHLGLTAMWECLAYGYADLSSQSYTESTTVSMDGKSYGKISKILRDRHNEPELFTPFQNKLLAQELTQSHEDTEEAPIEPTARKKGKK